MEVKKHVPNILSTARLIMALVLPFVFFNATLLTTFIFYLMGASTDAVDGFLARRWKAQSKYGKIIDPIADKLLNGLALLFTSIVINPWLFILTGFEALIGTVNILRFKRKRSINVIQIGRVKTAFLFFATVFSLLVPMVPSLEFITNMLIGLTASLQVATASKYIHEYHKESKISETMSIDVPLKDSISIEKEEIKNLKYVKEKLMQLSHMNRKVQSIKVEEPILPEKIITEENFGISRTLKK